MKRYLKPVDRARIRRENNEPKLIEYPAIEHRCPECNKIYFEGEIGRGGIIRIICSNCKKDLREQKI